MKITPTDAVELKPVTLEGSQGCSVRALLSTSDGAPNFSMRQFEVEPGGHTPRHFHGYEHEVYVLEGEGEVWEGEVAHPLRKGDVVLVKPDEIHQFRNTGTTRMTFLCLIPNNATDFRIHVVPECTPSGTA